MRHEEGFAYTFTGGVNVRGLTLLVLRIVAVFGGEYALCLSLGAEEGEGSLSREADLPFFKAWEGSLIDQLGRKLSALGKTEGPLSGRRP